jgi:hypothetical protein
MPMTVAEPTGQFSIELLGDPIQHHSLGRTTVEVVDRLVDPAVHEPEAVGGADQGVAVQVQQVALQHLDPVRTVEAGCQRPGDLRVPVTERDPQGDRSAPAERLEGLRPHPANPPRERAEHRASFGNG